MAFKQASRAGTKALIGLYGGSGAGKTLSALYLARGLAGPSGNVFLIDTESGRGALYSDDPAIGGYLIDQLDAPYSSARYMEKINEAIAAGKSNGGESCIVIDSFSHEWEGVGGVVNAAETIAENRAKQKNYEWNGTVAFGDWKGPKIEHKRMMLEMLGAPAHVICCLRAQYKSHQVERKDYEKYGIQSNAKTTVLRDEFQSPIQDANFIYEMTIHAELRAPVPNSPNRAGVPILTKCPETLRKAFPQGERISVKTGAAISDWCQSGGIDTDKAVDLVSTSLAEARKGVAAYETYFINLPKEDKLTLTGQMIPHPGSGEMITVHDLNKQTAFALDTTSGDDATNEEG